MVVGHPYAQLCIPRILTNLTAPVGSEGTDRLSTQLLQQLLEVHVRTVAAGFGPILEDQR